MRHPKIIISGIALAAVAAVGGITAASAASSPPASHSGAATVRTASATVGGKTETILVNGHGLPLYTFADDHVDQVTGQGVEDFFVATPGLAAISTSSSSGTAPAAPSAGISY